MFKNENNSDCCLFKNNTCSLFALQNLVLEHSLSIHGLLVSPSEVHFIDRLPTQAINITTFDTYSTSPLKSSLNVDFISFSCPN